MQVFRRRHLVGQTPVFGFGSADRTARSGQLERAVYANTARQEECSACIGYEAEVDEGQDKLGIIGADEEITAQGEAHAGTGSRTTDGGDDHRVHFFHIIREVFDFGQEFVHVDFSAALNAFVEIANVATGRKGFLRTRKDDRADGSIAFGNGQGIDELIGHFDINGVHVFHIIHGDLGNAIFYAVMNLFVFHSFSPLRQPETGHPACPSAMYAM